MATENRIQPSRSRKARACPALIAYFGEDDALHMAVTGEFRPGRGWVTTDYGKRVNATWARKMAASGVTHVALRPMGQRSRPSAEFALVELTRKAPKA